MNPLRSVGARLALRCCSSSPARSALVYVVVVPPLESRLVDRRLSQLERRRRGDRSGRSTGGRRTRTSSTTPSACDRTRGSSSTQRRSPPARVLADRRLERSAPRSDVEPDPIALRAARDRRVAAAARDSSGGTATPRSAVRRPTRRSSLLFSASLQTRSATSARRSARLLWCGPRRARCSRSWSATAAPGCSRGASAGSSAPPSGSPPAASTSRSSITAATSSASSRDAFERMRAAARPARPTPAASSSPTPRTSCGRRSSRSAASSSC